MVFGVFLLECFDGFAVWVYSCFYLVVVEFGFWLFRGLGLCCFGFWVSFLVGLYKAETVVGLCFKDFLSERFVLLDLGFVSCCLFWTFALGRLGCCCLRCFVLFCDLYLVEIVCISCDFDDDGWVGFHLCIWVCVLVIVGFIRIFVLLCDFGLVFCIVSCVDAVDGVVVCWWFVCFC